MHANRITSLSAILRASHLKGVENIHEVFDSHTDLPT
jgi:hypothetical protein